MNQYPAMIATVNHVEPVPRRIRAFLGGEKVLDTTRALYVWEWPYYPQYYIPLADVRRDLLIPEEHTQQTGRGVAEPQGLRAGEIHRPHAARLLTDSPIDGLAGTVRGLVSELELTPEADGVPTRCVANFDNLHTLPQNAFRRRVVQLPAARMSQACRVLLAATGC